MTDLDRYIWQRLTWWDKLRGNFIFVPALLIVALCLGGLLDWFGYVASVRLTACVVVTMALGVAMRITLGHKVQRLKDQFYYEIVQEIDRKNRKGK